MRALDDGREAAILLVLAVVVSDTLQYYAGRLLGRRLLAPAISPKKTIEGAVGGFIGGTLAMAVARRVVAARRAASDCARLLGLASSASASSATCSSRC